jgi:hypothetical protein
VAHLEVQQRVDERCDQEQHSDQHECRLDGVHLPPPPQPDEGEDCDGGVVREVGSAVRVGIEHSGLRRERPEVEELAPDAGHEARGVVADMAQRGLEEDPILLQLARPLQAFGDFAPERAHHRLAVG